MFPPVDTKDITRVGRFVARTFESMYPGCHWVWLNTIFRDVEILYMGRRSEYGPSDVRYHDLEHTLQAVVCLALLLEGRHLAKVDPVLDARHFELAISAALLHDTGYIKLKTDTDGTGAKYTFCHVVRSCAFAASYLPSLGADDYEVEAVLGAINCTGPTTELGRLRFRQPIERVIGSALATADFLGQMAASDYPDELEILFDEFRESDEFIHLPVERRMFKSAQELMDRTPAFWEKFVRPKLDSDFEGVYRFLARPVPDGPNLYLEMVDRNIALIREANARRHRLAAEPAPALSRAG
jgi:hypothetical protein